MSIKGTKNASAYIPIDRRHALVNQSQLPQYTKGTVLFADISGFTALTEGLVRQFGPLRGVDELARSCNQLFTALINEIHIHGGSVIGFAGDSITCWFDEAVVWSDTSAEYFDAPLDADNASSILRAASAAFGLQNAMRNAAEVQISSTETITLGLKAVISPGSARRFLVGNPEIQIIDVLVGALLDRVAAGEKMAHEGEILADQKAIESAPHFGWIVDEWRQDESDRSFAVITDIRSDARNRARSALTSSIYTTSLDRENVDPAATRAWVLPPVYQRIQSQDQFLAELRPAAALFLRFSGINYDDDEDASQKLDHYIRWVQGVVDRYEGAVIQLTFGDKGSYLYAAFGAPIAHDDNLARAAATALELRQHPPAMDYIATVQIGISQGRMRVGAYGSPTRQTYAVLGDATNLAARLMSRAAYGQILVNQVVVDELDGAFEFQELGYATFKGKSEPEAIYSLIRQQSSTGTTIHPEFDAPLFGRDTELAIFDNVLAQTKSQGSQVIRIVGSAGIGKSHLAVVALQTARQNIFRTVIGACQSTAQESAYYPIRQIVRQLLDIHELSTESGAAEGKLQRQISHLEATLQVNNPDWLLRLPLLGELLGLPIPDTQTTAAFDPQLRREALITLVIEIIQSKARQGPLLILLEDVHWMDEASQELVLGLARAQAELPLLLMLMHRPTMRTNRNLADVMGGTDGEGESFLTRLAELPRQTVVELHELTPEGTAALVSDRLASTNVSRLTLDLIQGLAQGNPFYVEELVDALLDSEKLVPIDGTWALVQSVVSALRAANLLIRDNDEWRLRFGASLAEVELGIPDSIHGIVLARLDRLPEPVKLTLKVASVIGHVFEFEMLAHAHPTTSDSDALIAQIELIEERDFARLDTPDPHPRYAFRHNITQEVVYRTLLDEQRRDLHLAVGEAVESLQPDAVERLAYHFYNGDLVIAEVRAKAMDYLGEAGDRAKRDYANETALAFYDRALGLEERWGWMKGKIEVLHLLGQRQEEMETLDYAEYAQVGPPVEMAAAWGEYYESVGEYPVAIEKIQAGIELAEAAHDVRAALHGRIRLADIDLRRGDLNSSEQQYADALNELDANTNKYYEQIRILYGLGIVKRNMGEHKLATNYLEQALSISQQHHDQQWEAKALTALGFTAFSQRKFGDANHYYSQAEDIQSSIGDRVGRGTTLLSIGQTRIREGNYTEAQAFLNKALVTQQLVNNRWLEAVVWSELGIIYIFVGDWNQAHSTLEHALKLCDDIGADIGKAHISCNLGQIFRELGWLEKSTLFLDQSIAIARMQSEKNLELTCLGEMALLAYESQNYQESIRYSLQLVELNKRSGAEAQIADLTQLAISYLAEGQLTKSKYYASHALKRLNDCNIQELDYPHREYFRCYQVFCELEQEAIAKQALDTAITILQAKAYKISDPMMRESFLTNVSFNHKILREAHDLGLVTNDCD